MISRDGKCDANCIELEAQLGYCGTKRSMLNFFEKFFDFGSLRSSFSFVLINREHLLQTIKESVEW
jgi:hypothetical protein